MNPSALRLFADGVVVITGGASGIGAAFGRLLAERGARVVLADRQAPEAEAEARRIAARGGRVESAELDVRDADAFQRLVAQIHERHGRIDLLFNNAGIGVTGPAEELTLAQWRDGIEVNLMGVVHGVQAAYPLMVRQGFGHIINTASMAGLVATPGMAPYGVTKGAVVALSRALRVEGALTGVRVSVLCPGFIRTAILESGGRFGHTTRSIPPAVQRRVLEQFRPMDVDQFVRLALPCIERNEATIIFPKVWRLLYLINRISPALGELISLHSHRRVLSQMTE